MPQRAQHFFREVNGRPISASLAEVNRLVRRGGGERRFSPGCHFFGGDARRRDVRRSGPVHPVRSIQSRRSRQTVMSDDSVRCGLAGCHGRADFYFCVPSIPNDRESVDMAAAKKATKKAATKSPKAKTGAKKATKKK